MALGPARVLDLTGVVYNTGLTTLKLRGRALRLLAFKAAPRLADPARCTFR